MIIPKGKIQKMTGVIFNEKLTYINPVGDLKGDAVVQLTGGF